MLNRLAAMSVRIQRVQYLSHAQDVLARSTLHLGSLVMNGSTLSRAVAINHIGSIDSTDKHTARTPQGSNIAKRTLRRRAAEVNVLTQIHLATKTCDAFRRAATPGRRVCRKRRCLRRCVLDITGIARCAHATQTDL